MTEILTEEMFKKATMALDAANIDPGQTHYAWVDGEIVELKPKRKQNLDVLRNRLAMYGMKLVDAMGNQEQIHGELVSYAHAGN